MMNAEKRQNFFNALRRSNPNPKTELQYSTNFELLIAVILSAQATDISVNKATHKLYQVANTPKALLKLGEQKLKQHIKTIGLFNTKAKNIIKTCQLLTEHYEGKIPKTRAELEALPGVGRKTANVVLNTAFQQPTMAVDTHIFRISNRTRLAPGKNVLEVEKALLARVPKEHLLNAHHWLILHGRYTCTAKNPKCATCAVKDFCDFKSKNINP
jgi:endonuclease-3